MDFPSESNASTVTRRHHSRARGSNDFRPALGHSGCRDVRAPTRRRASRLGRWNGPSRRKAASSAVLGSTPSTIEGARGTPSAFLIRGGWAKGLVRRRPGWCLTMPSGSSASSESRRWCSRSTIGHPLLAALRVPLDRPCWRRRRDRGTARRRSHHGGQARTSAGVTPGPSITADGVLKRHCSDSGKRHVVRVRSVRGPADRYTRADGASISSMPSIFQEVHAGRPWRDRVRRRPIVRLPRCRADGGRARARCFQAGGGPSLRPSDPPLS